MIISVGVASVRYVDITSARNMLILGVSIMLGLMVPTWMVDNPGIIDTGQCCDCKIRHSPPKMPYGFVRIFILPPCRFLDLLNTKTDSSEIFASHGSWSKEEVYRLQTQRFRTPGIFCS